MESDGVLKAVTGFAGGIGRSGAKCGAFCAGVVAFGLLYGRDLQTMKHPDANADSIVPGNEIEVRIGSLITQVPDSK